MLTLVFDTETTGMIRRDLPVDHDDQPGIVQLGAILYDERKVVSEVNLITLASRRDASIVSVSEKAFDVHGIDDRLVERVGVGSRLAFELFHDLSRSADRLVAYNTSFDLAVLATAAAWAGYDEFPIDTRSYCAMLSASRHLKIPGRRPGEYAWPKLQEAFKALVDPNGFDGAHDAMADVRATAAVLWALEDAKAEIVKL